MDVTVKFTKATLRDVNLMQALNNVMAIAVPLAAAMRERVTVRHELVTVAKPYADKGRTDAGPPKKPAYYLSPSYAQTLGMPAMTRWESSAQMHQAAGSVSGTGYVTGEMWKGLQVRNTGTTAIIEFGGSSLGASSTLTARTTAVKGSYVVTTDAHGKMRAKQAREQLHDEGGQVLYRRKPKLVRNAEKAGRVLKNSRIGLLMPSDAEKSAMWQAFRNAAATGVCKCLGSPIPKQVPVTGDRALYDSITRNFNV